MECVRSVQLSTQRATYFEQLQGRYVCILALLDLHQPVNSTVSFVLHFTVTFINHVNMLNFYSSPTVVMINN